MGKTNLATFENCTSESEEASSTCTTVKIGGCEGPEAMYVKLISADDHEFFIKRETALASGTFKAIPSHVLSKICQYFMYRIKYADSAQEVPGFPIAADIALELLMAANFLDC